MARRYSRRKRSNGSSKKRIMIPVVSTAGGLAILTAMKGPEAIQKALGGNVVGAINDVAGALTSQAGKQALVKAAAGTLAAKLVLKNMPRSIGRVGPLMFTTQ